MSDVLRLELKNSILFCELNRPDVKNAMNADLIQSLKQAFESVPATARAVVLSGSGKFFCAGGDLNWMKDSIHKSAKDNEEDTLQLAQMLRAIDDCPVPVIALVQGGAFGGGVGLLACSDIVIADKAAVFSLSEVRLGLIPATIGPFVLRKIGVSEARRLYTTGHRFTAAEALQIHLVHELVSADQFDEKLSVYLKDLSASGPQAVRTAKALVKDLAGSKVWQPDISEATSQLLSQVRVGSEAQEGMAAFFEKRKPNWVEELKIE